MIPDPPVREDGRCIVCRGSREQRHYSKVSREQVKADPFCSRECASEWFGTTLAPYGQRLYPRGRAEGEATSPPRDRSRAGEAEGVGSQVRRDHA